MIFDCVVDPQAKSIFYLQYFPFPKRKKAGFGCSVDSREAPSVEEQGKSDGS